MWIFCKALYLKANENLFEQNNVGDSELFQRRTCNTQISNDFRILQKQTSPDMEKTTVFLSDKNDKLMHSCTRLCGKLHDI